MTEERMSVHKALCELKTMDDRIAKVVNDVAYVYPVRHSADKIDGVSVAEVDARIRSCFQRASDLISRRNAIKRAVVLSNALTTIEICGNRMSIAEAIDMKQTGTRFKKYLLQKISRDYSAAKTTAGSRNGAELESRALTHISSLVGQNVKDTKGLATEYQAAYNAFIEAQTTDLRDPIGAVKVMESMQKEIDDFEIEVDSAISVSNAITEITVVY